LGSFGAMYQLGQMKDPILVSGTDGVGTKLEIAFKTKTYDTVGIDCVAMCVNDVLCHGAKPLFFLDYMACGKLDASVAATLVSGITEGCLQSDAALVGGETAEMPGFYKDGDYDIAGFTVGVVEKDELIDGSEIKEGDTIIALPSTGVHSNGFSLVRKLITDYNAPYGDKTIGEELLTPTRIYVKPILELIKKHKVSGLAHMTGGGIIENLPRVIPTGLEANVEKSKIKILPIFKHLMELGVEESEMWGTFNMGVGFIIIADKDEKEGILKTLEGLGEAPYEIGVISKGENGICLR